MQRGARGCVRAPPPGRGWLGARPVPPLGASDWPRLPADPPSFWRASRREKPVSKPRFRMVVVSESLTEGGAEWLPRLCVSRPEHRRRGWLRSPEGLSIFPASRVRGALRQARYPSVPTMPGGGAHDVSSILFSLHPVRLLAVAMATSSPTAEMEFWKGYAYSVKDASNGTDRSDAMYVVVPLLGVALLIVIGLFIIWRCQLQKVTHHRPSYPQNRGLASRAARSLPRVRVHREAPPSQSEAHYQRDPSSRGAADGEWGQGLPGQLARTLVEPDHVAPPLSRLCSATPPPSYEEVTGQPDGSSAEEPNVSYSDPPPKYEEIMDPPHALGK
ncbi:transmembrane gamma-carboxyglutamic acid protein 3 isoform X1 [Crotalus tigris]|uniref:transmembrane gamma-carboxyglutamic acid protein 3 isoform X1 n=1 Tax=Crotalus tigris TaxID=88082 RepID=UPI00192F5BC5|nr:transmembrane gamma-carboxyglutamic acid protein 3 isoform X1 [Crotalus tigris]